MKDEEIILFVLFKYIKIKFDSTLRRLSRIFLRNRKEERYKNNSDNLTKDKGFFKNDGKEFLF
jgi:hypothetical protein